MNVFVRCGGFNNKGDESMLLTVQRELTRRLEKVNFFLRVTDSQVKRTHDAGMFPVSFPQSITRKIASLVHGSLRNIDVLQSVFTSATAALEITKLSKINAIIDISGFAYSDVFGSHHAKSGAAHARRSKKHLFPYICLPQTWGPFKDRKVSKFVNEICTHASLVYARDEVSLSHLRQIGADNDTPKIQLCHDVAFLFNGLPESVGRSILNSNGIPSSVRPLVGITPNMRVYERLAGLGLENDYVQLLIRTARYYMDNFDASIVLIPHEIKLNTTKNDDRFLCNLVNSAICYRGTTAILPDYYTANHTKSVISCLDLLVGSRFHSILFAFTSGVPTVALGWAHKYQELMRLAGLEELVLDHTKFLTADVHQVLEKAWQGRMQYRNLLNARIPVIQNRVEELFDDVSGLLQSSTGENT